MANIQEPSFKRLVWRLLIEVDHFKGPQKDLLKVPHCDRLILYVLLGSSLIFSFLEDGT